MRIGLNVVELNALIHRKSRSGIFGGSVSDSWIRSHVEVWRSPVYVVGSKSIGTPRANVSTFDAALDYANEEIALKIAGAPILPLRTTY